MSVDINELQDTSNEKAVELLIEWFQNWQVLDEMPAKMPKSLHTRTVVYLMEHANKTGGRDAVSKLLQRITLRM
jgi:hypothetical protein